MFKLEQSRVAYIDCDDTCVLWNPEQYQHDESELVTYTDEYGQWKLLPHKKHLDFMLRLKQQGYGIVLWSKAGTDWAEKVAKMLKIENIVDIVASKPEFVLDDLKTQKEIIGSIIYIHPETGEFERH